MILQYSRSCLTTNKDSDNIEFMLPHSARVYESDCFPLLICAIWREWCQGTRLVDPLISEIKRYLIGEIDVSKGTVIFMKKTIGIPLNQTFDGIGNRGHDFAQLGISQCIQNEDGNPTLVMVGTIGETTDGTSIIPKIIDVVIILPKGTKYKRGSKYMNVSDDIEAGRDAPPVLDRDGSIASQSSVIILEGEDMFDVDSEDSDSSQDDEEPRCNSNREEVYCTCSAYICSVNLQRRKQNLH